MVVGIEYDVNLDVDWFNYIREMYQFIVRAV